MRMHLSFFLFFFLFGLWYGICHPGTFSPWRFVSINGICAVYLDEFHVLVLHSHAMLNCKATLVPDGAREAR